jgi:hypothetical protein
MFSSAIAYSVRFAGYCEYGLRPFNYCSKNANKITFIPCAGIFICTRVLNSCIYNCGYLLSAAGHICIVKLKNAHVPAVKKP